MDNASGNAADMIGKLQMQFNRGRQAAITNELVDIITGTLLSFSTTFSSLHLWLQVRVLCKTLVGFRARSQYRR